MRLVILPGMDGGGALLAPFVAALPPTIAGEVLEYPPDRPLGYGALESRVRAHLGASSEPTALLAESFSGPIAIRIAADPPPHLRALVLVATFAALPMPAAARFAVTPALFALRPPRAILRRTLLAPDSSDALVDALGAAIARTSPRVMAQRIRAALRVDVRAELASVQIPTLVLEGRKDHLLRPLVERGHDPVARLPADLRVVTLDTPHLVLEAAPIESASVVVGFLASGAASGKTRA